jgi:hypothetical protein
MQDTCKTVLQNGDECTDFEESSSADSNPLTEEQKLLIECYRSGQIEEWAWAEHLAEHPNLAVWLAKMM